MTGDELREAEVGEEGAAGGVEEDVGGLDVAMDDADGVGGGERARKVARDAQHGGLGEGLAAVEEGGKGERRRSPLPPR